MPDFFETSDFFIEIVWSTSAQRIVAIIHSKIPSDSGIKTAMARPPGAKNKRTLLRESNMRDAAVRAQLGLATTDDESIKADSLAVMEEAMSFFYRLALKEKRRNEEADLKAIRDNLREAVNIAKEVAPYRHARLSSVKVAADRASMPAVRDDITTLAARLSCRQRGPVRLRAS